MLKQRILTAIVLLLCVLAIIFYVPLFPFSILAACLVLGIAWEWSSLLAFDRRFWRYLFLVAVLAILIAHYFIPPKGILSLAVIWWLVIINRMLLNLHQHPLRIDDERFVPNLNWWDLLSALVILAAAWQSLLVLRELSPMWLLYCLVVVWVMDSAAYFVGRAMGRHPLAPHISPKKTWEGAVGGLVAVVIITGIWLLFVNMSWTTRGMVWLLSVFAAVFSVFGDLYESQLKRVAGVKDSGNLLPGHGGLFDRLDAVLAALPLLALGLLLLNV